MMSIFSYMVEDTSDDACLRAFGKLKENLVSTSIVISLDWRKPFEVMCDVSGVTLGVLLR